MMFQNDFKTPYRLSPLTLAICVVGLSWSPMSLADTSEMDGLPQIGADIPYINFDNLGSEYLTPDNDVLADLFTENNTITVENPNPILRSKTPRSAITKSSGIGANLTPKQSANLNKITEFYQKNTDITPKKTLETTVVENVVATTVVEKPVVQNTTAPMCHGAWVYPTVNTKANNSQSVNVDNRQMPIYAESDYGYHDNKNYAELIGNVKINQGTQQVTADKISMDINTGVANAQGNVLLIDSSQQNSNNANNTIKNTQAGGLITLADEMTYQTNSTQAVAKDVAFASVPLQAHGYAKQFNKLNDTHYDIDEAMFTTCSPDNPTWHITAKNIDVNTETGRGQAKHAVLKVKNLPAVYLPYFNFPIDDRRSSGFLVPKVGYSSDGGLTLRTPYYFNLAPNYDATFTPTVYTNRNPMLTGEFRYLTEDFGNGDLTVSYLPNDKQYNNQDRESVLFHHYWQSKDIKNLSAHAIYQYASDSSYLDDFSTFGSYTNQLNLPRRLQANYYNDYLTALAKFETFQTLENGSTTILDKDKPYYRLPQLSLRYRLPTENLTSFGLNFDNSPIEITGVSDFAYFKRPIDDGSAPERSGGRLFNKVTATYPFTRSWGYIKPAVSLQHLYTQFDEKTVLANNLNKDNKSQSIFVPEYSLDMGLHFMKNGSPLAKFADWGGYQLISPRLKYVYSPYKDQTDVPNFNTRLASLNFPQLFENSWFLGYERLPDNNFISSALNYRYIDGEGLTRLDASVGQQWFLDDIRVRLDNSNTPIKASSLGTVLQLSSQPHQNFWVDLDGSINTNGSLGYLNTQFRYTPKADHSYSLGYIKRHENVLGQQALSAITASAYFPINSQWKLMSDVQYDNLKNRYSDIKLGLSYDSCCYGFSLYGRRYVNELDDTAEPTKAIMMQISLSGITTKQSTGWW